MARGSGAGPEALLREGLAHHRARRWAEAAAAYRALLDLDPEEPNAWNLLGVVALEEGRPAEALPLLERALALYPRGAAYHVNRGNALRHLGRWDEAEAAYRQALGLEPALPDAVLNLGQLFNDRGRYVEAAEVLETGLPRGLEHPAFCLQFSRALRTLGLLAEAEAFERQAAALAPEDPKVLNSIGITRLAQGDARGAVAAFRQALDQDPAHVAAHSNLLGALQYDAAADAEACFQAHLGWGRTHGSAGSGTDAGWLNPRDPDRRIRLGYLSPDFREHSVAYFLEPLLAHHDPRAVEVHAYAHLPSPTKSPGACGAWCTTGGTSRPWGPRRPSASSTRIASTSSWTSRAIPAPAVPWSSRAGRRRSRSPGSATRAPRGSPRWTRASATPSSSPRAPRPGAASASCAFRGASTATAHRRRPPPWRRRPPSTRATSPSAPSTTSRRWDRPSWTSGPPSSAASRGAGCC